MHGALLVAHQDVPKFWMFEKLIVNGQYNAPRVAEDGIHPQLLQGLNENLRSSETLSHNAFRTALFNLKL
jgi:hypothetical protein